MKINNLFTDENAVSPVIGVILMVAITVILAAVIGAFVLGIGGSQEQVPQASFSYTLNSADEAEVTHQGGESIDTSTISFTVDGTDVTWSSGDFDGSGDWSAGETFDTNAGASDGSTINIIWSSSSSDQSNIIGEGSI